ncbi:MAG: hypothetical protein E6Q97_00090 [Desulfurellales bacterium]|nr:MAG: hypothetical protein E6Q97_00090 [Desulfurellales bacterium]
MSTPRISVEIQAGVPIPPGPWRGAWVQALAGMAVGDSFEVPHDKVTAARAAMTRRGWGVVQRIDGQTTRLWRTS